jgi:ATP-binding cassette subfamily C (CFTR/MRP) protein 1
LNVQKGYVYSFALTRSDNLDSKTETATRVSKKTSEVADKKSTKAPEQVMPQMEQLNRKDGDISTYTYYFASLGLQSLILFFVLEAAFAFLSTFPTVWLQWWAATNSNDRYSYWLGCYAAFQLSGILVVMTLAIHLCWNIIVNSGARLHLIILKTVMNAPMSFFATTDTGITTNRFSQDVQLIDSELPISLLDLFAGLFICVSQAGLIANGAHYIAAGYPLLFAVFYFTQKVYLKTSRQLRLMDLETKSPLYSLFLESLSGLPSLRAFGWEEVSIQLNDELLDTSQRPFYLLWMVQRWLTLTLDMIGCGLAICVVGMAVGIRLNGVNAGATAVALVNIISFTDYLKYLIVVWTNLETALGAVARIKEFNETTEVEHLAGEDGDVPDHWPRYGGIDIKNLSASYDGTMTNLTLNNISLTIRPGEKIGICGPSGR